MCLSHPQDTYGFRLLTAAELERQQAHIEAFYGEEVTCRHPRTPDGLTLSVFSMTPHQDSGRRLIIVPGRGECGHKYAELLYSLSRAGIGAGVCFVRGQGDSSPTLPGSRRSHVEDFSFYRSDLGLCLTALGADAAWGMLGFSLGGLIALDYVMQGERLPRRLALIAPFLHPYLPCGDFPAVWLINFGNMCRKTALAATQTDYRSIPFASNHHTHCEVRYRLYHEYYARHSELAPGGVTYGFLCQAMRTQRRLARDPRPFPVPVHLQYALLDRVVSSRHAAAYYQAHCPPGSPQPLALHGSFHDVLNERDDIRNPALSRALEFIFGSD